MKRIFPSSQFKKDYKHYRHQPHKMALLAEVIDLLANDLPIPDSYKPHMLIGQYKGCMECHIQNDYLLIWFDCENDIIELVRLGTRSELFGKKR